MHFVFLAENQAKETSSSMLNDLLTEETNGIPVFQLHVLSVIGTSIVP